MIVFAKYWSNLSNTITKTLIVYIGSSMLLKLFSIILKVIVYISQGFLIRIFHY